MLRNDGIVWILFGIAGIAELFFRALGWVALFGINDFYIYITNLFFRCWQCSLTVLDTNSSRTIFFNV